MPSCEIVLPELHAGQLRVIRERGRFNSLACGRRWGKSTLLLSLLLDDHGYGALDGYPVAWFSANSKIFDEVWRLVLQTLPAEVISRTDVQKHRIELVTGGLIDFWSLDGGDRGGAGRGRRYRRVAIDEAALVPDMLRIWSKAIRPTLIDMQGDAYFASTPRGILNDFHTIYQRGVAGSNEYRKGWKSWRVPTSDNPHLSREELKELEAEYTGLPLDYRQEMLAEFVEDQGQVFDLSWINELPAPKGWRPIVHQAWDLAGTKQDLKDGGCESVGVAITKDWMDRWWLLDVERGKWDTGTLLERILSFGWKHKAVAISLEDPVAMWLEPFLKQRQQQSGKHLPIRRVGVQGRGDKVARAQASVVPVMANGSFYCDPAAPWYRDMRRDLSAFPAAGKDLVDALSLGFAEAMQIAQKSQPPPSPNATHDPRMITWDELVKPEKSTTPRKSPWTR
jgi:predicted phage terminase large subunit-like protein